MHFFVNFFFLLLSSFSFEIELMKMNKYHLKFCYLYYVSEYRLDQVLNHVLISCNYYDVQSSNVWSLRKTGVEPDHFAHFALVDTHHHLHAITL